MNDELFEKRRAGFRDRGEPLDFAIAAIAEALDTVAHLREHNAGGETVETRLSEYKNWDPDIFRVDKEVEDGFRRRLAQFGEPVVLLSEEAGRVEIGGPRPRYYVISDPFDGSWLFKRGIEDFWYSSIAFYDSTFNPVCCAVGDAVHRRIVFADGAGAWRGELADDRLDRCVRLDAHYRESMGRKDVTDVERAGIESYAMKPSKFLIPLVERYRGVIEPFKFLLPNGGPYGFADVAEGRIDVYFAPSQPFVDVFSGCLIAGRAGAVVTDFAGSPLRATGDHETVHDVVASTNPVLHAKVLDLISRCK